MTSAGISNHRGLPLTGEAAGRTNQILKLGLVQTTLGGATGVLLALALPPWNLAWTPWVAFLPLLLALWQRPSPDPSPSLSRERRGWLSRVKRALLCPTRWPLAGWSCGILFFLVSLHWITTVTVAGWLALALYLAIYPAAWASYVQISSPWRTEGDRAFLYSRANLLAAAKVATAWVALEYLRGILFTGFGWNSVGVMLHGNLPLVQIAEWTGVGGLSFMVVVCNVILLATLWRFVLEIRRGKIRAHFDFTLTLLGVVGVFLFGVDQLKKPSTGVDLKVAAIQTNIPLTMRRDQDAIPELLRIHEELTDLAAATEPDLIIWPEAAIPGGILIHWDTRAFVEHCASLGNFALMHGTLDAEGEREYNAVALLPRDRSPWQIHHKIHLVPFGEYIPFRKSFPLFAWIAGDLVPGDFFAGTSRTLLDLKEPAVLIGPLICFEDTLDDLVRRFARDGARLLVNVTNDAWFLESAGSHQHFVNARLRAVENRLPIVRAANTGVTAVIDPWGREKRLQKEDGSTFLRGYLTETIQVPVDREESTFFTQHGPLFSQGALAIFLLSCVIRSIRHNNMELKGQP